MEFYLMLTLRIICNFLENLFSGVRRSLDAFFAFMRPTAVATAPDLNLLHASATGLLMVQEQQTRRLQMDAKLNGFETWFQSEALTLDSIGQNGEKANTQVLQCVEKLQVSGLKRFNPQDPSRGLLSINDLADLVGVVPWMEVPEIVVHSQENGLNLGWLGLTSNFFFAGAKPRLWGERYKVSTVWKRNKGAQIRLLNLAGGLESKQDLVPLAALLTQPANILAQTLQAQRESARKDQKQLRIIDFGNDGSSFGLRCGFNPLYIHLRAVGFFEALSSAGYHGWRGRDQFGSIEYIILLAPDRMNPVMHHLQAEI